MATPKGFEQRAWFLTTVAAFPALTAAEISGGVELTVDLPEPINFAGTSNFTDTSDISSSIDKSEASTFTPENLQIVVWRRNPIADEVAYPALDDNTTGFLVKFEGGGIAGANPAIGDKFDAVEVTIGTKADVSRGRSEGRQASVPLGVSGTPVRAGTVT
jgi:hypothetical protein